MASNDTKPGNLTQEFLRRAADDQEGALATMFLAAFGVSLMDLMLICQTLISDNDVQVMLMAVTAGVQIRNHVVFVGRDYGNIRTRFPQLVIEGQRRQMDIYNFGALHALGHMLSHLCDHAYAKKVISKAGSCINGDFRSDSEAGKINQEIASNWDSSDYQEWRDWNSASKGNAQVVLDKFFKSIPVLASKFKLPEAGAASAKARPSMTTGAASLFSSSPGSTTASVPTVPSKPKGDPKGTT